MSSSKKTNLNYAAGIYLSDAQNPIHRIHTLTHFIRGVQYIYSHGEGGESWTSEKARGSTVHKAGSKIPTWLTVSSVNELFFANQFHCLWLRCADTEFFEFTENEYINCDNVMQVSPISLLSANHVSTVLRSDEDFSVSYTSLYVHVRYLFNDISSFRPRYISQINI